jgi:hypothetical protein
VFCGPFEDAATSRPKGRGCAVSGCPPRLVPRTTALSEQRVDSVRHPPLIHMNRRLPWVVACLILSLGACTSRSGSPVSTAGRFSQVYVSIFGFGDARVGAALIDRRGRRTGWNVDHAIDQIPGCMYGAGSDEGIPDDHVSEDTTGLAPADTVPGHPEPTPVYHYFSIQDSSGTPGLLREGGCELRLEPVASGHVTLAVTGTGAGFNACQDTTSVGVRSGILSRWWLSWGAAQGKCVVKISRMSEGSSSSSHK